MLQTKNTEENDSSHAPPPAICQTVALKHREKGVEWGIAPWLQCESIKADTIDFCRLGQPCSDSVLVNLKIHSTSIMTTGMWENTLLPLEFL